MSSAVLWIALASFALACAVTPLIRRFALAGGLLDVPNARSSHAIATPRGGGVAIVVAVVAACTVLATLAILSLHVYFALVVGGAAIACIGYCDDRYGLSARTRLIVHFAAACWAVVNLGGFAEVTVAQVTLPGWIASVIAVLAVVWALNLYNFMDGIDGLAGSEGVFVGCSAAAICLASAEGASLAAVPLVFAAACAGFLVWNWPPAKIFMGDVGSGYLGYTVGVMALVATQARLGALAAWLILNGLFVIDATVTLLTRLFRGDRVHEAHRTHAYQHLAARWGSHLRVTVLYTAINVLWLLPCALAANWYPNRAVAIVAVALLPIVFMTIRCRAGRPLQN